MVINNVGLVRIVINLDTNVHLSLDTDTEQKKV